MSKKRKPTVRVREARSSDMPAVRSLIRLYPRQLIQRDLPRALSFLVATINGKVVGCCALQIYSRRLAEMRSLAIAPEFKGLGVAKTLVEHCLRRAQERRVKQVLAVSSQAEFLERCGFSTFFGEKTALFYDLPTAGKEGKA